MVAIILDLFNKYPDLYGSAVVSSFYPNLIYMVRCNQQINFLVQTFRF